MDAYIGLGSNLDDPLQHVLDGIDELRKLPNSNFLVFSAIYRSSPMQGKGVPEQADFINAVARIDTELDPEALLTALQQIESSHGRVRNGQHWGPRTLDLDLLLYGDHILNTRQLTLPHPGLCDRDFVLQPLSDINPGLKIPGKNSLSLLLESCKSHQLKKIMTIKQDV